MLRAVILSLILFVAFGTLVPISTEYSEASVVTSKRISKKKKRADRYRQMAMRKNRKKARVSAVDQSSEVKQKTGPKKKVRQIAKKKAVKKRTRARSTVRTKSKVRRTAAKRKTTRSTRTKRKVKRSVRVRSTSKRRYTSKRKKRATTRRSTRRASTARRVQKKRAVRKYSQKWWTNYREQQSKNEAVAVRKREIRLTTIRLENESSQKNTQASVRYERLQALPLAPAAAVRTQVQMPAFAAPIQVVSGDVSMEVFGASVGETVTQGRNTAVGGISTTTLRRTVIDQMIRESGWVENDYQKDVDGKKVYVVVAKAPDRNNRIQAKTYYFTESNGRIYRVAANSNNESTEAAQKRSEEMIRTLDNAAKPQQAQNQ